MSVPRGTGGVLLVHVGRPKPAACPRNQSQLDHPEDLQQHFKKGIEIDAP